MAVVVRIRCQAKSTQQTFCEDTIRSAVHDRRLKAESNLNHETIGASFTAKLGYSDACFFFRQIQSDVTLFPVPRTLKIPCFVAVRLYPKAGLNTARK